MANSNHIPIVLARHGGAVITWKRVVAVKMISIIY
jgi:hypothetical protein